MEFLEAKEIMKQKMGDWKIMALASCEDNYPMVRNVSCLFYFSNKSKLINIQYCNGNNKNLI